VRGLHKEDGMRAGFGFFQARLQLFLREAGLF
jgi:hypothetical protein